MFNLPGQIINGSLQHSLEEEGGGGERKRGERERLLEIGIELHAIVGLYTSDERIPSIRQKWLNNLIAKIASPPLSNSWNGMC